MNIQQSVWVYNNGRDMREFLEENGDYLKGKHLIYALQTNLKSDRVIQERRATRANPNPAPQVIKNVIKIGKSTQAKERLNAYQFYNSFRTDEDPNAGIRLIYAQVIPKRNVKNEMGQIRFLVDNMENVLKRELRQKAKIVKGRGGERFDVSTERLLDIIQSDVVQRPNIRDEEIRRSGRVTQSETLIVEKTNFESGKSTIEATKPLDAVQKMKIREIVG